MKSMNSIARLMFVSVFFFSCFSAGNPEKTAEKFLSAINERKFEEANNKLTDQEIEEQIDKKIKNIYKAVQEIDFENALREMVGKYVNVHTPNLYIGHPRGYKAHLMKIG